MVIRSEHGGASHAKPIENADSKKMDAAQDIVENHDTELKTEPNIELGLTQEQKKNIRDFASGYFDGLLADGARERNSFFENDSVINTLAELSEDSEYGESGSYTRQLMFGAGEFLLAFADRVKELKKNNQNNEAATLAAKIEDALFSISPSIINYADYVSQIRVAAKTTRIPELQGYVGGTMVGEIAYEMSFARDEHIEWVRDSIQELPIAEQLDVIQFLNAVARKAAAQGEWAEKGVDNVERIHKDISESTRYPLIQITALASLERTLSERENPTGSVVVYHGDRSEGRTINAYDQTINREIDQKINPEGITKSRLDRYIQLSKDHIGLIDHSGLLHASANIDIKSIPEVNESKIIPDDIENHLKYIDNLTREFKKFGPIVLKRVRAEELLLSLDEKIFEPQLITEHKSDTQEIWAKIKGLEPDQWNSLFRTFDEIGNICRAVDIQKATLEKEFDAYVDRRLGEMVDIMSKNTANTQNLWFQNFQSELQTEIENNNPEKAKKILEDFARGVFVSQSIHRPQVLDTQMQGVADEIRDLASGAYYKSFMAQRVHAYVEENNFEALLAQKQLEKIQILEVLRGNFAVFLESVHTHLENLAEQIKQQRVDIHFVAEEEMLENPTVLPIGDTSQLEDEYLLFQQMHMPDVRAYIEQALGIQFSEITLRSQVQLLHFLAEQDNDAFDRISTIASQDGLDKKALFDSFFASASDKKHADMLLQFAENVPPEAANKIFGRYRDLLEIFNGIEQDINEFFINDLRAEGTKVDTRNVVIEMLNRVNQFLFTELEHASEKNIAEIDERMKAFQEEVAIFSSIFKSAVSENIDFTFDEISGLDFSQAQVEHLTPDQVERMKAIAAQNYAGGTEYDQIVLREFAENFTPGAQGRFDILEHNGEMIAFIMFKPIRDTDGQPIPKQLYVGAFNLDKRYQGSAIGAAVMRETMLREPREGNVVHGIASPDRPATMDYIEKLGYAITGVYDDVINGEVVNRDVLIECDLALNENVKTRAAYEHVLLEYLIDADKITPDYLTEKKPDIISMVYNPRDARNKERAKDAIALLTDVQNGYRGTRFFVDPTDSNPNKRARRNIMVFEKV